MNYGREGHACFFAKNWLTTEFNCERGCIIVLQKSTSCFLVFLDFTRTTIIFRKRFTTLKLCNRGVTLRYKLLANKASLSVFLILDFLKHNFLLFGYRLPFSTRTISGLLFARRLKHMPHDFSFVQKPIGGR